MSKKAKRGDKRTGYVSSSEIYDYGKSFAALRSTVLVKKKPHGFLTGIKEVELLLGLDGAKSVLHAV